tara:strand:+ start:118 stop:450 length:333 start_codon:yes stop_codon:yes gene_type:complete
MPTKLITKQGTSAGLAPSASDLEQGELAVNVTDKKLYTKNNSDAVVEIGTNPSALTLGGAVTITTGSGTPNGSVTANIGSLYLRTDSSAEGNLYTKTSTTGNTGWTPLTN